MVIGTGESPSPRNSQLCLAPNRRRCFDRFAFKKTCPCVPSRAGVAQPGRQRTDPTRSLGGSFSGIARPSKGGTGFLAREIGTQAEWAVKKRREIGTQADQAVNRQTRDRNPSQSGYKTSWRSNQPVQWLLARQGSLAHPRCECHELERHL